MLQSHSERYRQIISPILKRLTGFAAFSMGWGLFTAPAGAATLAELEWLAGHWQSTDGAITEVWMHPSERAMPAMFRWSNQGQTILEFIVIEPDETGLVLRFKHFDTDYRAWEADAPNTYRMTEIRENYAHFENTEPSGVVPKHMVYSRIDDTLRFCGTNAEPSLDACKGIDLTFEKKES